MLWYLQLCAGHWVVATAYENAAEGLMQIRGDGAGEFMAFTLRPRVTNCSGKR